MEHKLRIRVSYNKFQLFKICHQSIAMVMITYKCHGCRAAPSAAALTEGPLASPNCTLDSCEGSCTCASVMYAPGKGGGGGGGGGSATSAGGVGADTVLSIGYRGENQ